MQAIITSCSSQVLYITLDYFHEEAMAGDMLSTSELAEYLGIHEKHVYRLLRAGRLPGTRITGHWVFSRRLIQEWIEANSREALTAKSRKTKSTVEPHLIGVIRLCWQPPQP
jgi:excisionase family DNA binding protein